MPTAKDLLPSKKGKARSRMEPLRLMEMLQTPTTMGPVKPPTQYVKKKKKKTEPLKEEFRQQIEDYLSHLEESKRII